MRFVEDILVGFIGRPILTLIKWFRWPLIGFGLYFNAISIYDPDTGIVMSKLACLPFIVGFILYNCQKTPGFQAWG